MRTQGAGNLWRIMTSNVWADVFGNPVEGRDTQLAQVYEHYLPDVLCLQEMHPNWHASPGSSRSLLSGTTRLWPNRGLCAQLYAGVFTAGDVCA